MRLVFGDCTFDRERRELTRKGSVVHAGPKLLSLLELLIDARPRALTKQEIHTSLWVDTFVSDGTLTSLVAELRDAVGDPARTPRLVRTIHGYGYLFFGDVAVDEPAEGITATAASCRLTLGDREIRLPSGTHILGRSSDAAVFVDDVGVSRHHARITVTDEGATLEDLGSKNGTILDGRTITAPARLADGAVIVLGATAVKFRAFSTTASTATVTRHRGTPRAGD
ncbi:MAG TPA: FHA domain-containing protein [Vicinamibacterales bacterium]|nr:FHA domain-containing protein [Vicinamibacterales bacterium]